MRPQSQLEVTERGHWVTVQRSGIAARGKEKHTNAAVAVILTENQYHGGDGSDLGLAPSLDIGRERR